MSSSAKSSTRTARARRRQDEPQAGFGHDALILLSIAAALFIAMSVYAPSYSEPAGPAVQRALRLVLGAGMYLMPFAVLFTPLAFMHGSARHWLVRASAWAWCMILIFSLVGGLIRQQELGGLIGGSSAKLGFAAMGGFYPFVVALVSLLIIIRLAGRSLLLPVARRAWSAMVHTGAAAADFAGAVAEKSDERALAREERRVVREKRRSELTEEQRQRQQQVLAAELEAADAPENDSPIIRAAAPARIPKLEVVEAPQTAVTEAEPKKRGRPSKSAADEGPPQVRPLGTMKDYIPEAAVLPEVVDLTEARVEDDGFAAALAIAEPAAELAAVSVPAAVLADSIAVVPEQLETAADEVVSEAATISDEAPLASADGREELAAQTVAGQKLKDKGQLGLFASTQAGYVLPPLELLRSAPIVAGEEQHIEQRSRIIERTLASFNIEARCINAVVGPRVTRYELKIGPGINVSKIHGLADNLALELAVKAVRIEAPIPGMSAVGIEVPNSSPQLVTLRSVLESPVYQSSNHPLTVGLGRDIAGHPVVANLAKMPHLLVAGATGSGKSVCLNALIVSLLTRNAPDTLRLILIDPKRVEMSCYEHVPQLACPIVNEVSHAQNALKWVVAEMDRRYRLLEQSRARNIAAFNEMHEAAERLPFIVVVIDELADLMMLAGQTIEKLICRIAQLSRAVGIHLVVATQRPDVKVITGTIKANIPSRIAFAVVSHIDSRTILDGGGADRLLGSGDMLFAPIGENKPMRVQGAFLSDEEIDKVVEWSRGQAGTHYDEAIISYGAEAEAGEDGGGFGSDGRDEFFAEAASIVQGSGRASISYLQRRLKIGYNRAARVMEELEEAGVVSEPDHQGNRKVL